MNKLIIVLGFVALVYTFNLLTGSLGSVYNATDNQLSVDTSKFVPTYEQATEVANSLK